MRMSVFVCMCVCVWKQARARGSSNDVDRRCCVDCLALSTVPADGAATKTKKKKAVVELPPLVK